MAKGPRGSIRVIISQLSASIDKGAKAEMPITHEAAHHLIRVCHCTIEHSEDSLDHVCPRLLLLKSLSHLSI